MSPRLERALDLHVELAEAIDLGEHRSGRRWFIGITGGSVTGDEVTGEILPGGGDFALERGDGTWELEARYAVRLDGIPVEVVNVGLYAEGPAGGRPRYYLTTPRFRIGRRDGQPTSLDWLEERVFVGEAFEVDETHIRIEVYAVAHVVEDLEASAVEDGPGHTDTPAGQRD